MSHAVVISADIGSLGHADVVVEPSALPGQEGDIRGLDMAPVNTLPATPAGAPGVIPAHDPEPGMSGAPAPVPRRRRGVA